MPEYSVGEITLYAESSGSGFPLVLIGGTSFDASLWTGHLPWLSETRTVIAFDNRDVGRSTYVDEQYTPADMAKDTYALLWAMGFDRADVLGYSLGGAVAQELALAHPESVRSLILYSTWAGSDPWIDATFGQWERMTQGEDLELMIRAGSLALFTHRMLSSVELIEVLVSASANNPSPQRRDGLLRQWRADRQHEARDRLPSIACPTLVVGADEDVLIPLRYSQELAELIPGAELHVIKEAGHGALIERPDLFRAAIEPFLLRQD